MANEPAEKPSDLDGLVRKFEDAARGLCGENPHDYMARGISAGDCLDAATAIRSLQARCAKREKHLRIALDTMKMHGICGEECFACEDAARTLTGGSNEQ